jgi:hypothetical protein
MDVRKAVMDSNGKRLNLKEMGTRYDHYMELREVFMDGIDVLTRMNQSFISDADKIVKTKLTHTVEMITRRLDNLSDFADKTANYGDLARQVNLVGKHVTPLLTDGGKSDEKPEPKVADKPNRPEDEEGETTNA